MALISLVFPSQDDTSKLFVLQRALIPITILSRLLLNNQEFEPPKETC